jgi:glycosyltransferase involved in cell wall biosynthesis
MRPSIIILTFNSVESLGATLASISDLSDDIHVVDSGSTDSTVEIAASAEARIVYHPFENYGNQRNWAIDNLVLKHEWQLHLDADERLSSELLAEIKNLPEDGRYAGFFIPRMLRFLGRTLKHGGMSPTWHMRLFRSGQGRCESREYDQHFFCVGETKQLRHAMIDDIRMSLSEWTSRHNRWADAEVREILSNRNDDRVTGRLSGNVVERKRFLRSGYDRLPHFYRAFGLFIYRYVVRLGFLDGTEGLIFWVLQTFWFRFLIDAKLFERSNIQASQSVPGATVISRSNTTVSARD